MRFRLALSLPRCSSRAWRFVAAFLLAPAALGGQQIASADVDGTLRAHDAGGDTARLHTPTQKTFFVKRDLVATGIAIAGTAAVSAFDLRIARWARSGDVQGDSSRHDLVSELTRVNETPLMLAALATYGVGRVARSSTTADVGLHTLEALVLSTTASQVIRGVFGRTRPRVSLGDPFRFKPGTGFSGFETRSFPSLHTAAAFATATALVGEIELRRPAAKKIAAPLLYTAAMVPGLTRLYLDQHWASDVVAGAFLGALVGSRVVSYAHSHRRTRLDRTLLGVSAVPDGRGGVMVMISTEP
ncbi:MAG TPA: phosphatase PAP2 family protein [Gemmatimonadaceae bacterium]|nr:phosphatase PAP2 family protein [Gemmatimonadaceae bacterium]